MIYVDGDRCGGCATCVDVCPTGAISMRDGVAFIDEDRCTLCALCVEECPEGAILLVEAVDSAAPLPGRQVQPADYGWPPEVQSVPQATVPTLHSWALPALGSALLWTAREVGPRLARLGLDLWEQRTAPTRPGSSNLRSRPDERLRRGNGRRRRQHQRGRW